MADRRSYARNLALDRLANPANLVPVASAFYRLRRANISAPDRSANLVHPPTRQSSHASVKMDGVRTTMTPSRNICMTLAPFNRYV